LIVLSFIKFLESLLIKLIRLTTVTFSVLMEKEKLFQVLVGYKKNYAKYWY